MESKRIINMGAFEHLHGKKEQIEKTIYSCPSVESITVDIDLTPKHQTIK